MDKSWLKQASDNAWKKVFEKVKCAVVFMDYACAECLFWNGGPMLLINAGAVSVKDFSSFECGTEDQKKAVFILSSVLIGKTLSILEDIVRMSKFEYCVVITTVDIDSHGIACGAEVQHSGMSLFEKLEENVCLWMGNVNYTCEILYTPLFMAPCTPFLFVTPTLDKFFPLLKQDLCAIDSMRKSRGDKHPLERLSDVHFFSLPISYQVQIKQLVCNINLLLDTLRCKEEIFALGQTSRLIGTQLANFPHARQRRKVSTMTASLILVDRSLDLSAASRHSDVSLVDKIIGILSELPGHCNNIAVDMVRLTAVKPLLQVTTDEDEISAASNVASCPGSLCPPDDTCPQLLVDMITKPQKEAVVLIKRNLMEACIEEGIEISDENQESDCDEIFKLVESFQGNAGAIMYHNNLLQLSMAAAQTLSHNYYKKWMQLSAMEKLLLLEDDPIVNIVKLINEEPNEDADVWTVEDVLEILVHVCSLKDVSSTSDDIWDDLSSSLSLAISESDDLPEGLNEILSKTSDEDDDFDLDVVQDAVEQIIQKLKSLYSLRTHFTHFRDLRTESFGPPKYKPLLQQLMSKIFDSSNPDLQPDLEHISTGLMDLLKSGFSMFKKVSKPRPNDAQVLFLFVVGGITFEEASLTHKLVQEYNTHYQKDLKVILGSTRIVSPSDVVDKVLFSNNLSPSMLD